MSEQNNVTTEVAISEKNISEIVLARINMLEKEGGLNTPLNYSVSNAIKSAWLMLLTAVDKDNRPVLSVCTKESIANTLLDMVIQGLNPAKKQCYFICYGNSLQLSRSYLGSIAVTKRLKGIKDIFANIIYEGDEFEYIIDVETGSKKIIKHNQSFQNIDITKIKGAYAIIIREGTFPYCEIMTMKQIRASWEQGKAKGESPAHKKFPEEMAKKTTINRACKTFWNTSDDSSLLIESVNRTRDFEELQENNYSVEEEVKAEISANANKVVIDIKQPEKIKTQLFQVEDDLTDKREESTDPKSANKKAPY